MKLTRQGADDLVPAFDAHGEPIQYPLPTGVVRPRLTVGSLFAGIGGFDLGFERAGFEIKWQVEIDPFCRKVLEKHWPHVRRYANVRTVGEELERVDVICGGFPCQDISHAGKRAGITGARSGLFTEAIRIADVLGPNYLVLENVPALLYGGMGEVLGALAESGFDAEWDCIPASAVRARHRRDRIWIVAYPNRSRLEGRQRGCLSQRATERLVGESGASVSDSHYQSQSRRTFRAVDRGAHQRSGSRSESMNIDGIDLRGLRRFKPGQSDTPWRDDYIVTRGSLAKAAVPPDCSWWAETFPNREAFFQRAAREAVRMQPAVSSAVVTAKDSNGKAH